MFKILFKMLMVVGLVLGAFNYYLVLTTGRSMFTDLALQAPQLPDLPTLELPSFENPIADLLKSDDAPVSAPAPSITKVYKWRDANGQVNYSTTPPPAGLQAETLSVDSRTNIIPALETGASLSAPRNTNEERRVPEIPGAGESPYSPGAIQRLFEQARGVQQSLDQRYQDQQRVIEETQ